MRQHAMHLARGEGMAVPQFALIDEHETAILLGTAGTKAQPLQALTAERLDRVAPELCDVQASTRSSIETSYKNRNLYHSPGTVWRFTWIHGMYFGRRGLRSSFRLASCGVRLFLRLLQSRHAQQRFSHVDGPPALLG